MGLNKMKNMKTFKLYFEQYELLTEAKANTHLTHLEELVLTKGEAGYKTARGFITDLLSHLQGKSKRKVNTTVKWDGAPAMFVGKHPDTGKFFVGTKSVFNKTGPKINYTDNDVEMNHGHAPGLADKLKKALKYLPKLGIKGVLQGDFMFDSSSVNEEIIDGVKHFTFKPNTIKYAVEKDSKLGKEIANSVFGIIFHTGYADLDSPPQYGINVKGLKKVPGVWVDDAVFSDTTGTVTLTTDEAKQVRDFVKTADSIKVDYRDLPLDLLNIYANSEIQKGKFLEDPEDSFNNFVIGLPEEWQKRLINVNQKLVNLKLKRVLRRKWLSLRSKKMI